MKLLAAILAAISVLFNNIPKKSGTPTPFNTAIIAYTDTYYAPAVADPGNLPWAQKLKTLSEKEQPKAVSKPIATVIPPPPPPSMPKPVIPATPVPSIVTAPPLPQSILPPADLYLANPEPIATWFWYSSFNGNSTDGDRILPEMSFDREYWRMEVLAYWAPTIIPPKPAIQKDYFKLEVYEKKTDKLVYTMTSGSDETIHKFQSFRKPGAYYFKIYARDPSQYEVNFTISSKLAQ